MGAARCLHWVLMMARRNDPGVHQNSWLELICLEPITSSHCRLTCKSMQVRIQIRQEGFCVQAETACTHLWKPHVTMNPCAPCASCSAALSIA